jgi:hypothetical protein
LSQEGIFNPGRVFSTHHYVNYESIFSTLRRRTELKLTTRVHKVCGYDLHC